MIPKPIALLATLAGSNYSTIVFAQPPLPTRLRVLLPTSNHPCLIGFGCFFGSSHSPFRLLSSDHSFVVHLRNQAPLHTRKKCLPCSSAFRFKKVPASLYKLGFAFGLACTVPAQSVGTPSFALPLFFFAIGFLLRQSRLFCTPETPIRCFLRSHKFLSGVHRRGCKARLHLTKPLRSVPLPFPASYGRAKRKPKLRSCSSDAHRALLLLPSVAQAKHEADPQQRLPLPLRYLSCFGAPPAVVCSQGLAIGSYAPVFLFFRPKEALHFITGDSKTNLRFATGRITPAIFKTLLTVA